MMKEGLLLMIDRKLMFPGPFEGILGLGIPTWAHLIIFIIMEGCVQFDHVLFTVRAGLC